MTAAAVSLIVAMLTQVLMGNDAVRAARFRLLLEAKQRVIKAASGANAIVAPALAIFAVRGPSLPGDTDFQARDVS